MSSKPGSPGWSGGRTRTASEAVSLFDAIQPESRHDSPTLTDVLASSSEVRLSPKRLLLLMRELLRTGRMSPERGRCGGGEVGGAVAIPPRGSRAETRNQGKRRHGWMKPAIGAGRHSGGVARRFCGDDDRGVLGGGSKHALPRLL